MTVMQLVQQLREASGRAKMPVLVIAESVTQPLLLELLNARVDDVLLFLFAAEKFEEKVETLLRRSTR